jgi:C-terminal processing protease CtpA/Prc
LEKSGKGDGTVLVKKILPSGAAQEDGRIRLKDRVTHVDGTGVDVLDLNQVLLIIFEQ